MAFIRIDPALPVIWRTPHSIQVGAETIKVVLDPFTPCDERMLAAARAGIPSEALAAVGGCSAALAAAFVERIRPVLVDPGLDRGPIAATVRVRSANREEIVHTARMLGLVGAPIDVRPQVGVIVTDHAVPLRAYRDWIREGLTHFAVVFGTPTVKVGPIVVPGETGCLRCADLHRRVADPAWPAMAAQLVGLPAASARHPILRTEALCTATRLAIEVSRGLPNGFRHHEAGIEPHPECGCILDLQVALPLAS